MPAPKKIKVLKGTVVRRNDSTTVSVDVSTYKSHRVYQKRYRINKTFLVHDAHHKCQAGDRVAIASCRPLSKRKYFIVVSVKHHTNYDSK